MKQRVSILMGVYNCGDTLAEAIESILAQTYSGWKLIICDDGSTDNSYAVAKLYQEKYPAQILLIRNEKNLGLNDTLNHCLQYADTEYVARMDGDDLSLPERLETELAFLDAHPAYAIVSAPMIYFDEMGDFRRGKGRGEPSLAAFAKGTPFCHAPCMVRREAYEAVGGYAVSPKRLRVEDWDLWVRMYEKGYRGCNLPEPLYKMRDDRNAFSRRKFRYRINEARVSASAVKKLKLPRWNYIFALRPILVGLLPKPLYSYLHRKKIA